MPTYHACVIIHKFNKNALNSLLFLFFTYCRVYAYAIGFNPVKHIHLLLNSKSRLDYSIFKAKGVYVKFKLINSPRYFFNVKKYIQGHKIKKGGGKVSLEELLKDLKEKVEKIEKDVEELKTLKQVTTARQIEINLSRMTIKLQPARKGLAMRIRFARYIKRNRTGEYYVILSKEDLNNLVSALQTIQYPNTETANNSGQTEKSSVKTQSVSKALK